MKRIKEDEIQETLKKFNNQELKIQINGDIKEEIFFENSEVVFLNKIEFQIKDKRNNIILNLSYIEEINLLEKNKLKFLTETKLEILIYIL